MGSFKIVAGNGIDEVTGEDGIDVTNFPLGPGFPKGVFISQDHANPGLNQNNKLVPWQSIANAFNPPLAIDSAFDPRTIGAGGPGPGPGPDTTPPATTIDSGPTGTIATHVGHVHLLGQRGIDVRVQARHGRLRRCTSPKTYSGLGIGPHTFQVRATDTSNNTDQTPASRSWTVGTATPSRFVPLTPSRPLDNPPPSAFPARADLPARRSSTSRSWEESFLPERPPWS